MAQYAFYDPTGAVAAFWQWFQIAGGIVVAIFIAVIVFDFLKG